MSADPERSTAQRLVGDVAPKLAELTDNVLFGDAWARPELARRDRSLVTVASLVTNGSTEQLVGHLRPAKQNGLTEPNSSKRSCTWPSTQAGPGPCPRSLSRSACSPKTRRSRAER